MNHETLARATDFTKRLEERRALRAEMADLGITLAAVARRARRTDSLVSHFFRGAPSDYIERVVRGMVRQKRARLVRNGGDAA